MDPIYIRGSTDGKGVGKMQGFADKLSVKSDGLNRRKRVRKCRQGGPYRTGVFEHILGKGDHAVYIVTIHASMKSCSWATLLPHAPAPLTLEGKCLIHVGLLPRQFVLYRTPAASIRFGNALAGTIACFRDAKPHVVNLPTRVFRHKKQRKKNRCSNRFIDHRLSTDFCSNPSTGIV